MQDLDRSISRATIRDGVRILGRAAREQPRVFATAVAASIAYGAAPVLLAWVLGQATERVVLPALQEGRTSVALLVAAMVAIVVAASLRATGGVARRLAAGMMQYRLQADYRSRLARRYLELSADWHRCHQAGDLLSRVSADVEAAWSAVIPLPMALGVAVLLVTAGASAFATDLPMTLLGFSLFPVAAVLNVAYQRRLAPLVASAQQRRAEASGAAYESFEGALVVKTLGREEHETARFAGTAGRLRDANTSVAGLRALFDPALEALPNLGILAVLAVGTVRVQSGDLSVGETIQLTYLFIMMGYPIRAFGWVLAELPRSVVGWQRVSTVLDTTEAPDLGDRGLPGSGPLRLDLCEVSVGYVGGDVLHRVSLRVAAGTVVAVVGPTGSGKSTLVSVLAGLLRPRSGTYLINGVDRRHVRPDAQRAAIASVPQHTILFADSVRGNVTLGLDVDEEGFWDALRLAQVDETVSALPDGPETQLGERGITLSGGQRQRIALARAVVRRPRLLVLDDATSNVDAEVEGRIVAGLREAGSACTMVMVAYRTATLAQADLVVYLQQGRIVDQGGHAELMTRCDGYRELVTAYARAEEPADSRSRLANG